MKRFLLIASLSVMCTAAFATGNHNPPKPTPAPTPIATAAATSVATADATAKSASLSAAQATGGAATSNATGGNANAMGGAGGAGGVATATTGASDASADNSLSQNIRYERSAPSIGQGSLMIGECGAGGNAGGSNRNGAGFLGFAWTPRDCKLLMVAQAYQALGMVDAACEMLNGVSVTQARWKELDMSPPKCEIKKATVQTTVATKPADLSEYAKVVDVDKKIDKAFRSKQAK